MLQDVEGHDQVELPVTPLAEVAYVAPVHIGLDALGAVLHRPPAQVYADGFDASLIEGLDQVSSGRPEDYD